MSKVLGPNGYAMPAELDKGYPMFRAGDKLRHEQGWTAVAVTNSYIDTWGQPLVDVRNDRGVVFTYISSVFTKIDGQPERIQ